MTRISSMNFRATLNRGFRVVKTSISVIALGIFASIVSPFAAGQAHAQNMQSAGKPAWALSVEERIALRTDPDLARTRVDGIRSQRSIDSQVHPLVDRFDGKSHPELFLPHEVFDQLVKLAFLASPRTAQTVRDGFMPQVKLRGLPVDFWPKLQSISSAYIADIWAVTDLLASGQQQSGLARQRRDEVLALKYKDTCISRADALAAARNQFGRERFDRFLYEVVAVGMFVVADRLPDPKQLRAAEEGCR